jgi:hypothetical protein
MLLDAFDALIARQSPLDDAARVAVIIRIGFPVCVFRDRRVRGVAAAIIRNGMPLSGVAACCLVNRGTGTATARIAIESFDSKAVLISMIDRASFRSSGWIVVRHSNGRAHVVSPGKAGTACQRKARTAMRGSTAPRRNDYRPPRFPTRRPCCVGRDQKGGHPPFCKTPAARIIANPFRRRGRGGVLVFKRWALT